MRTSLRRWTAAVVLSVAAVAVVRMARAAGVVDDLMVAFERKSLDYRMAWYRGPLYARGTAPPDVAVVAIDDASLRELGRFALWPRRYYADILDTLRVRGAAAVAFDILFSEPDTLPERVAEVRAREISSRTGVPEGRARTLLEALGGDDAFARALRTSPAVLAVGMEEGRALLPVASLRAAAFGLGHAAAGADPDGVMRRIPVVVRDDGASYLALGLAAVAAASGAPTDSFVVLDGRVEGRGWKAVVGDDSEVRVDFPGPAATILTVPFAEVLAGRVPGAVLEGRIVFVGATAPGLGDVFTTPFGTDVPGVEIHAALAQQVLDGRVIGRAAVPPSVFALLLAVPTVVAAMLLAPWAAVLTAGVCLLAYTVACFETFAGRGTELPLLEPTAAWAAALLLTATFRYGVEARGRRFIQQAFARYVSPDVVEEIARAPEALRLGGERRDVTVGFVDIRGFTTLSETLEPEALTRLLNRFFSLADQAIRGERGSVDKYIGDAVMMVFGAPNSMPDHASRACAAALRLRASVEEHAGTWRALGAAELRIGIGLESGPAVVGNVGSEVRFDYTALGDTVNTASRIQDANKRVGTSILVGPRTREAAAGFRFREVGEVDLRGKGRPVPLYELLGIADPTRTPTYE